MIDVQYLTSCILAVILQIGTLYSYRNPEAGKPCFRQTRLKGDIYQAIIP